MLDQTHKTSYEGTRDKMFSSKLGFLKKEKKKRHWKKEPSNQNKNQRCPLFFFAGKSLAIARVELLFFVIARFPLVTGFTISNENRQTASTLRISRKTLSRFTEDKVSPVARKALGNFLTLFRLYYICIYSIDVKGKEFGANCSRNIPQPPQLY